MRNSPRTASIDILDDNSLLHIFYLCRPFLLGEYGDANGRLEGGSDWVRERWWYKLAHVCQRWRNVALGSPFYLGLSLVCTRGTPVSDMLANSPPLPLVIDHFKEGRDISAEDEEATILALRQRARVRRVRLGVPVTNLLKLIMAIDEEYPILEYLVVMRQVQDNLVLTLPETFQAPHLRHLVLTGFSLPIGSPLLTAAVGLVTLCLHMTHPSSYFQPNTLLQWISSMPQLETLVIAFYFALPNRDIERQLTHMPVITPIALPNLHDLNFFGVSTYLEALIHRITTPRLKKLIITFLNQLTFSVPRLLQFMNTTNNISFERAKLGFFGEQVNVAVYRHGETETFAVSLNVRCQHLDWQVSSVAQIVNPPSQMFSAVEHLTLERGTHILSSEEHNEVDPIEWRKLLSSFSGVKTLQIDNGLVEGLSRCLESDDGGLLLVLIPELQELTYSGSDNAFTSFVNARQKAGRPITLHNLYQRSPDPRPFTPSFETSSIAPASNEAGRDLHT